MEEENNKSVATNCGLIYSAVFVSFEGALCRKMKRGETRNSGMLVNAGELELVWALG